MSIVLQDSVLSVASALAPRKSSAGRELEGRIVPSS
jgi:hypothetical protein